MLRVIGWSIWAILPIFGLAFHYGPGQKLMHRDLAIDRMETARSAEAEAEQLQAIAYAAQFETLEIRKQLLQHDSETTRLELDRLLSREQQAYSAASDAWKLAADRYQQVESLLDGSTEAKQVRWLRGRALVRAGEVFNGIEALKTTLDEVEQAELNSDKDAELLLAAREELAAAHYYGARLLREEGRSADVWRQVAETSRQQFRFLAEQSVTSDSPTTTGNFQRNLERVLDLEQQDRSELVGKPIPKDSPRARRPGDGEPGKSPGIGPPRGDQPGSGASGMMEIGEGW